MLMTMQMVHHLSVRSEMKGNYNTSRMDRVRKGTSTNLGRSCKSCTVHLAGEGEKRW